MKLDDRGIDPEFSEILEALDRDAVISRENLEESRALHAAMRSPLASDRVDFQWHRVLAGGRAIPVVCMRPPVVSPAAAIVWLHGGGFVMGTAEDPNALAIAETCGCLVFSVDYRLAPEHPFPAALHDGHAVLEWVRAGADRLGVDPDRIGLGGVSAGGGLAAGLALFGRDRGDPPLRHLHLVAPMLDHRHATGSGRYTDHPVWNRATSLNAWEMYLGHMDDEAVPAQASPSRAIGLAGLPRTWIGVGSEDLFRDEDVDFARRMNRDGGVCAFEVFPGLFHGASSLLPGAAASRRMREAGSKALSEGLATGQPPSDARDHAGYDRDRRPRREESRIGKLRPHPS